jgi:uncharacterized protein
MSGNLAETSGQNEIQAWHYVTPFAVFMLLTQAESLAVADDGKLIAQSYVMIYCLKIVAVLLSLYFCRPALNDFRPAPQISQVFISVVMGLLIGMFWVHLEGFYPALPESIVGKRSAFNPMQLEPVYKYLFLTFRMTGLIILVPIIEELFIRDFILRYVTSPDWENRPAWQFSGSAAAISTVLFVAGHPEWLPALLCGLMWLWLLRSTKNLRTLVISHAVANLGLAVYSFVTGDWHFL